jgi:hypothetical protein
MALRLSMYRLSYLIETTKKKYRSRAIYTQDRSRKEITCFYDVLRRTEKKKGHETEGKYIIDVKLPRTRIRTQI